MTGTINVTDFNLADTLLCGQAFRWTSQPDGWFAGVVGEEVWRLRQRDAELEWDIVRGGEFGKGNPRGSGFQPRPVPAPPESRLETAPTRLRTDPSLPAALCHYLALDVSLPAIFATFPEDDHLRVAVTQHPGLRVLRQEPWETLASFIASSSKQIVQIRQIVATLSRRFGEPVDDGHSSFPTVNAIARCSQQQLWDCKLGFRAKNLLATARLIDSGKVRWEELPTLELERALEELDKLPGVGEKIALCTLLFSCGFDRAFPIDVWVERALRRLYFPQTKTTARELRAFTRTYFGPHAGWAQQYLFFAERKRGRG